MPSGVGETPHEVDNGPRCERIKPAYAMHTDNWRIPRERATGSGISRRQPGKPGEKPAAQPFAQPPAGRKHQHAMGPVGIFQMRTERHRKRRKNRQISGEQQHRQGGQRCRHAAYIVHADIYPGYADHEEAQAVRPPDQGRAPRRSSVGQEEQADQRGQGCFRVVDGREPQGCKSPE
jgi:hypothetical protein